MEEGETCSFILFYQSIVDLQCWANFCCTAKWFSYTHTHTHTHTHILFLKYLFHFVLSQDTEYSSLCCTLVPRLSVPYTSLHLLTPTSHPVPSPLTTTDLFSKRPAALTRGSQGRLPREDDIWAQDCREVKGQSLHLSEGRVFKQKERHLQTA